MKCGWIDIDVVALLFPKVSFSIFIFSSVDPRDQVNWMNSWNSWTQQRILRDPRIRIGSMRCFWSFTIIPSRIKDFSRPYVRFVEVFLPSRILSIMMMDPSLQDCNNALLRLAHFTPAQTQQQVPPAGGGTNIQIGVYSTCTYGTYDRLPASCWRSGGGAPEDPSMYQQQKKK